MKCLNREVLFDAFHQLHIKLQNVSVHKHLIVAWSAEGFIFGCRHCRTTHPCKINAQIWIFLLFSTICRIQGAVNIAGLLNIQFIEGTYLHYYQTPLEYQIRSSCLSLIRHTNLVGNRSSKYVLKVSNFYACVNRINIFRVILDFTIWWSLLAIYYCVYIKFWKCRYNGAYCLHLGSYAMQVYFWLNVFENTVNFVLTTDVRFKINKVLNVPQ